MLTRFLNGLASLATIWPADEPEPPRAPSIASVIRMPMCVRDDECGLGALYDADGYLVAACMTMDAAEAVARACNESWRRQQETTLVYGLRDI